MYIVFNNFPPTFFLNRYLKPVTTGPGLPYNCSFNAYVGFRCSIRDKYNGQIGENK